MGGGLGSCTLALLPAADPRPTGDNHTAGESPGHSPPTAQPLLTQSSTSPLHALTFTARAQDHCSRHDRWLQPLSPNTLLRQKGLRPRGLVDSGQGSGLSQMGAEPPPAPPRGGPELRGVWGMMPPPSPQDSHCGNCEHPARVATSRFRVGCQQRDIFSCSP